MAKRKKDDNRIPDVLRSLTLSISLKSFRGQSESNAGLEAVVLMENIAICNYNYCSPTSFARILYGHLHKALEVVSPIMSKANEQWEMKG